MLADKAWEKSRAAIVEKIGMDILKDAAAVSNRAREVFKEIDTDGNGKIDEAELQSAMGSLGVKLSKKEVVAMMMEADEDG